MTFTLLTDDKHQLITRSAVCSKNTTKDPNLCQSPAGGEMDGHPPSSKPVQNFIYLKDDNGQRVDDLPTCDEAPEGTLSPDELVGRSFLLDPDEDGQRLWANIVRKIETYDEETQKIIKTHFLCEVPDHKLDQLRDYHDLLERLDEQSFKKR